MGRGDHGLGNGRTGRWSWADRPMEDLEMGQERGC